jgi:two-component system chemotaxis response regulator CheY
MSKKIVFVDDSKTVLASVEVGLEDMVNDGKISIITFTNPLEFLGCLQAGTIEFDLMFVDINMPEMNGIDLVLEMKKIDAYKTKPVLVLTTETSDTMKAHGKAAGVTGWVQKPFSDAKIQKAISKVLGI